MLYEVMIPGTKPRATKKNFTEEKNLAPIDSSRTNAIQSKSEAIGRRELFQGLLPTLGQGVTKLLRASNNLKRDLIETARERNEKKSDAVRREQDPT